VSVSKILQKPKDAKLFTPDERWVLPNTQIGMEFEYEGVKDPEFILTSTDPYAALWVLHNDDSLKDYGAEYTFRDPLFGKDASNAIDWLMAEAVSRKFKCTKRAGIHVHLDVRDLEVPQLIGLIILYTIVEPILYRWIGENRENSIFCVPFYKADESLLDACGIISNAVADQKNNTHTAIETSKAFERYAGLNLQALAKFGSIEFRHMRTTHDKDRVINWINMIMSLKAATFKLPTSDGAIVQFAKGLTANQFLDYIFGPKLTAELWTPFSDQEVHQIGIATARDLALHGLGQEKWTNINYPKGEHQGFKKFLSKKSSPVQEARDPFEMAARMQVEDALLGLRDNRPRAARPRLADPAAFPAAQPWIIDDNEAQQEGNW
jgi:hypothetical protein